MTSIRRILITVALSLAGLGLVTTPASASTPAGNIYQPPTPYSNDYSFDPECPGLDLWVDGHNSGTDWILNVPGSNGQAFLANDQYSFREVWKNTKTGRWFTIQGRGFFQEYAAVRVPRHQVPPDLVPPDGLDRTYLPVQGLGHRYASVAQELSRGDRLQGPRDALLREPLRHRR